MKRFILVMCASLCGVTSWAWSNTHRTIAYIAQDYLTPKTEEVLAEYLDSPISEYALWADYYVKDQRYKRGEYAKNRVTHIFSVNDDWTVNTEPVYAGLWSKYSVNYEGMKTINDGLDILNNHKEHADSVVQFNLKVILHLIGEMHCPVHYVVPFVPGWTSKYRHSYFKIWFEGKKLGYHAAWDGFPGKIYKGLTLEDYKLLYDTWDEKQRKKCCKGEPMDWAEDMVPVAVSIYDRVEPGDHLDKEFFKKYEPVYGDLVRKAAYRMAHILNTAFDPEYRLK